MDVNSYGVRAMLVQQDVLQFFNKHLNLFTCVRMVGAPGTAVFVQIMSSQLVSLVEYDYVLSYASH